MKSSILSCAIILTLLLGALNAVFADDVIWNFNPINGNWHVAENWTPEQVPRGSDTAHFALSKITGVSVERQTHIQEVVDQANFTVRASQSGDRPTGSLSFSWCLHCKSENSDTHLQWKQCRPGRHSASGERNESHLQCQRKR